VNEDWLSSTAPIITLIFGIIVLVYNVYQIWFFPEKYINALINGVKDWWPFANFYRKWYASKKFLWLFRIAYTLMLVAIIIILALAFLGSAGAFA
jgi:hypothetical protein